MCHYAEMKIAAYFPRVPEVLFRSDTRRSKLSQISESSMGPASMSRLLGDLWENYKDDGGPGA